MAQSKIKKIGKYEVVDVLGRGGMGVVYKAVDPAIGRTVAIKMITGAFIDDPDLLKRFYREAQSTGNLQHPNIVTVYDLGDQEGVPYLVIEFLEGEGLDKIIAGRRSMTIVDKLNLAIQVCSGLHYAHEHNVVHRDIKPPNVMVLKDGNIKIVDFGIARIGNDNLTRPGQVVGSIHYMSPEQVNAGAVDRRTDIFSAAVMLYELLTYSLPFEGKDMASTLLKILQEPPPPLSVYFKSYPPELDAVMQRALAKDREERYQTAEDFGFDLIRIQEQLKRGMVTDFIATAEALIEQKEWLKAKEEISQVLRVDRQNSRAIELSRIIQGALLKQQRSEQVRQLKSQAEIAVSERRLDEALGYLDEAVAVDKTNPELLNLREIVQQEKKRRTQFAEALHRAELAHDGGELESARAAVEEALSLEPDNAEAKALHGGITRELAERDREKKVQGFIDEARKQISSRRFTSALEVLKQAEQIAPAAPMVHELMLQASTGREQERRRKEVEAIAGEIEDALNHDDNVTACRKADEALLKFPDDRALLKLKKLADNQRDASEKRRKKAEYIQRAKDALRRKAYPEAIQLMETARTELGGTEFDDLLQFARDEETAQDRRRKVEAAAERAQAMIAAEDYDGAVKFLETTLEELPDEELRIVLVEARREIEECQRKVAEILATAERLLHAGRYAECIRQMEAQPSAIAKNAAYQGMLARAREELVRHQAINSVKEAVRDFLSRDDFTAAAAAVDACQSTHGESRDLELLRREVANRQTQTAKAAVDKALSDVRMLLLVRSFRAALNILNTVSAFLPMCPPETRQQYDTYTQDCVSGLEQQKRETEQRRATEDQDTVFSGSGGETIIAGSVGSGAETVFAGSEISAAAAQVTAPVVTPPPSVERPSRVATTAPVVTPPQQQRAEPAAPPAPPQAEPRKKEEPSKAVILSPPVTTGPPPAAKSPEAVAERPAAVASPPAASPKPVEGQKTVERPPSAVPVKPMEAAKAAEKAAPAAAPLKPVEAPKAPASAAPVAPPAPFKPERLSKKEKKAAEKLAAVKGEARQKEVASPPRSAPVVQPRPELVVMPSVAAPSEVAPAPAAGNKMWVWGGAAVALLVVIGIAVSFMRKPSSSGTAGVVPVAVRTSPQGATVRVTDHTCTTPNCTFLLSPGEYDAQATLEGYEPASKHFTVETSNPNASVELSLTARAVKAAKPPETPATAPPEAASGASVVNATVKIAAALPLADVAVDGRRVGAVRKDGRYTFDLAPGDHVIELSKAGYQTKRIQRRFASGETVNLGGPDVTLATAAQPSPTPVPATQPARTPVPAPAPPPAANEAAAEWARISGSNDANTLDQYVKKYPGSPFAGEATKKLDQLRAEAARKAAPQQVATAPPPVPASTPAPRPAAPDAGERPAILGVVNRYAAAYEARNVDEVAKLWPNLQKQQLKKIQDSFKAARAIRMNLQPVGDPAVDGDRASVTCTRLLQYTFDSGAQKPVQDQVTLKLKKQNGLWVLDSVQ
jgi:hypothetical protein